MSAWVGERNGESELERGKVKDTGKARNKKNNITVGIVRSEQKKKDKMKHWKEEDRE